VRPTDELKEIAEVLESSCADTTHVQIEIESMLMELQAIKGRKPHRREAA